MNESSQCTPNLESLLVSINNTETPLIIGVVYRPPTGDFNLFLSELNSLLEKLPSSNVYLSGDFNVDLFKSTISDYENTIYGNGFAPLISIATHFKPGFKPSCIDNILTNSTDNIICSGAIDAATGHHVPIFCLTRNTHTLHDDEPLPPRYNYSESNMNKFEIAFQTYITQHDYFNAHEINEITFENFMKDINKIVDDCFLMDIDLLNSKRNKINNPWITNGIIASINRKDYLYKLWRKSVKILRTKEVIVHCIIIIRYIGKSLMLL